MLHFRDTRRAGRAVIGMVATVSANVLLSAVFGIAAFAQPAMGRLFLAGAQNAEEFYDEVYGAPLLVTALLGLVLFMVGGALMGSSLAADNRPLVGLVGYTRHRLSASR